MKVVPALLVVVLAIGAARAAREAAVHAHGKLDIVEQPYAPTPESAPLLSLGFRELAADLLYIRLRVYYGAYYETSAHAVAALAEAIQALDPKQRKIYSYGANAMTIAPIGVDQSLYHRAVALLEKGIVEFPEDWQMPMIAGQMYIQDLTTDDPAQRHAWDERGTLLVESAIRKPGAPIKFATWVAHLRSSKLGQRERAVQGLNELLLVTNDKRGRQAMLDALAKLEHEESTEIASELWELRARFESEWKTQRPALPASMFLLVGPRLPRSFDLANLATGGLDFIGSEGIERLEPLYAEAPKQVTP